jgi:cysteine-rich repeat protein
VCIACVQSLHFLMDELTRKCVCAIGYKEVLDPAVAMLAQCLPICGDGIVLLEYETCDDKNTVEGDGCSAKCQSEKDFDCGVAQPSACVLNVNIGSIVFSHVSRELGKNQAIMSFKIFPIHGGLAKMKWERLVKFNFSSTAVDPARLTFNYQPLTGELTVTVPYSEELEESHLESFFALDPAYIVSQPSSFLLTHQLKGANAPLIFEE